MFVKRVKCWHNTLKKSNLISRSFFLCLLLETNPKSYCYVILYLIMHTVSSHTGKDSKFQEIFKFIFNARIAGFFGEFKKKFSIKEYNTNFSIFCTVLYSKLKKPLIIRIYNGITKKKKNPEIIKHANKTSVWDIRVNKVIICLCYATLL